MENKKRIKFKATGTDDVPPPPGRGMDNSQPNRKRHATSRGSADLKRFNIQNPNERLDFTRGVMENYVGGGMDVNEIIKAWREQAKKESNPTSDTEVSNDEVKTLIFQVATKSHNKWGWNANEEPPGFEEENPCVSLPNVPKLTKPSGTGEGADSTPSTDSEATSVVLLGLLGSILDVTTIGMTRTHITDKLFKKAHENGMVNVQRHETEAVVVKHVTGTSANGWRMRAPTRPPPAHSPFELEKLASEMMTKKYIKKNTSIAVVSKDLLKRAECIGVANVSKRVANQTIRKIAIKDVDHKWEMKLPCEVVTPVPLPPPPTPKLRLNNDSKSNPIQTINAKICHFYAKNVSPAFQEAFDHFFQDVLVQVLDDWTIMNYFVRQGMEYVFTTCDNLPSGIYDENKFKKTIRRVYQFLSSPERLKLEGFEWLNDAFQQLEAFRQMLPESCFHHFGTYRSAMETLIFTEMSNFYKYGIKTTLKLVLKSILKQTSANPPTVFQMIQLLKRTMNEEEGDGDSVARSAILPNHNGGGNDEGDDDEDFETGNGEDDPMDESYDEMEEGDNPDIWDDTELNFTQAFEALGKDKTTCDYLVKVITSSFDKGKKATLPKCLPLLCRSMNLVRQEIERAIEARKPEHRADDEWQEKQTMMNGRYNKDEKKKPGKLPRLFHIIPQSAGFQSKCFDINGTNFMDLLTRMDYEHRRATLQQVFDKGELVLDSSTRNLLEKIIKESPICCVSGKHWTELRKDRGFTSLLWDQFFDFTKEESNTRKFFGSVSTNVCQLGARYTKTDKIRSKNYKSESNLEHKNIPSPDKVLVAGGGDPGQRTMITIAYKMMNEENSKKENVLEIPTRTWRSDSKITECNNHHRYLMAVNQDGIVTIQSQLKTTKTSNASLLLEAMMQRKEHYPKLYEFYVTKSYRNMRFTKYRMGQITMEHYVRVVNNAATDLVERSENDNEKRIKRIDIYKNRPKIKERNSKSNRKERRKKRRRQKRFVLGFGEWRSHGNHLKGNPASPVSRFYEELAKRNVEVGNIDEYRTSKSCSKCLIDHCNHCNAPSRNCHLHNNVAFDLQNGERPYKVLKCPTCFTLHGRDINSGRCLCECTKAIIKGRDRPCPLKRRP